MVRIFQSVCFLFFLLHPLNGLNAQSKGAPLVLDGDTLIMIYGGRGPITPAQRAAALRGTLLELAKADSVKPEDVILVEQDSLYFIRVFGTPIMMFLPGDTIPGVGGLEETVDTTLTAIRGGVRRYREMHSGDAVVRLVMYCGAALVFIVLVLWLMSRFFPRLYRWIRSLGDTRMPSLRMRGINVVSGSGLAEGLVLLLKLLRLIITLNIFAYGLNYVLAQHPMTARYEILTLARSIVWTVVVLVAATMLYRTVKRIKLLILKGLEERGELRLKELSGKMAGTLAETQTLKFFNAAVRAGYVLWLVTFMYIALTTVAGLFSWSAGWYNEAIGYLTLPLRTVGNAIMDYLPNLFFILVLSVIWYYTVKLLRFIFIQIQSGVLRFTGFDTDWAMPTYKLVRTLVLVFFVMMLLPYLPGSDSEAFRGISIFVGVLFSLSSSSALTNIVAGSVLTYMRPFKIGDRVKIADTLGDVMEKSLLVTRIRTSKLVEITIPNAMVLGSHIINYSTAANERGVILHTSVTIGYDVPWPKVHELMIRAAAEVPELLADPAPFVLQNALGDYSVSYEINAYTKQPGRMAAILSALHQGIQNSFNEAGVEILSPMYNAVRDGNPSTVPDPYLPPEGMKTPPATPLSWLNPGTGKTTPGGGDPSST